jgi:ATP-binding cassette subfamily C (CFTR/MRP) protein 1
MIQQWLNLVLQLICAGLAFLVVVLAVELQSTVSPGFTGVALVNIISLALNMADVINS